MPTTLPIEVVAAIELGFALGRIRTISNLECKQVMLDDSAAEFLMPILLASLPDLIEELVPTIADVRTQRVAISQMSTVWESRTSAAYGLEPFEKIRILGSGTIQQLRLKLANPALDAFDLGDSLSKSEGWAEDNRKVKSTEPEMRWEFDDPPHISRLASQLTIPQGTFAMPTAEEVFANGGRDGRDWHDHPYPQFWGWTFLEHQLAVLRGDATQPKKPVLQTLSWTQIHRLNIEFNDDRREARIIGLLDSAVFTEAEWKLFKVFSGRPGQPIKLTELASEFRIGRSAVSKRKAGMDDELKVLGLEFQRQGARHEVAWRLVRKPT